MGQSIRGQRRWVGAGEDSLGRVQLWRRDVFCRIVEHDLVELPHRPKGEVPEVRSQPFPEYPLATHFRPYGLEEWAAELLDLVDEERQHHEHGKDHG